MTVCVAAVGGGAQIFLATDRMITSGDVEFEPDSISKIRWLTQSVAVLWAGNAAFQSEVLDAVIRRVSTQLEAVPDEWLRVRDVATWYADEWAMAKRRRAELALLAPLGMTVHDLTSGRHGLSDAVATDVLRWLTEYSMPDEQAGITAAIIAGADTDGPLSGNYYCHLYRAWNGDVVSQDAIGFAAVGAGARHATSHFMQAAYHPTAEFGEALWLTYSAKRRAEVAPGVGSGTDMAVIGSPGNTYAVTSERISDLDAMFKKVRNREARERRNDAKAVKVWLDKSQSVHREPPSPNSQDTAPPAPLPHKNEM